MKVVKLLATAILWLNFMPFSAGAQEAGAAKLAPEKQQNLLGPHRLPADVVTKHTVSPAGRTLSFRATAGSIKLTDDKGAATADIAFTAYQIDGSDPIKRPVTFVFNGGPGSASAWLQLGALGPWRIDMTPGAIYPSAPVTLLDNNETWLDFTDLVFIDPAGTGYSLVLGNDEVRKKLWSIDGDVASLSETIRRWLVSNQRLQSPKFIVGESYSGLRAPKLAQSLSSTQGIGIAGLVLISPVIDFGIDRAALSWMIRLPSYAAAFRERSGPVTRENLADVEAYATGEYLRDYLRGPGDADAVARMVTHVAALTGIDPALVKQLNGRVNKFTFQREFDRANGRVIGAYDASVSAYDPEPASARYFWLDPASDGFEPTVTTGVMALYATKLGWKIEEKYETLNSQVNRSWDWGKSLSLPSSDVELRQLLAIDPNFKVLVTGGLTDIQVPYLENKMVLDQIPDFGKPKRLSLRVYGGGHMHYARDASRQALREDARTIIYGN